MYNSSNSVNYQKMTAIIALRDTISEQRQIRVGGEGKTRQTQTVKTFHALQRVTVGEESANAQHSHLVVILCLLLAVREYTQLHLER